MMDDLRKKAGRVRRLGIFLFVINLLSMVVITFEPETTLFSFIGGLTQTIFTGMALGLSDKITNFIDDYNQFKKQEELKNLIKGGLGNE